MEARVKNFSNSYWWSSRNCINKFQIKEQAAANPFIFKVIFLTILITFTISCGTSRKLISNKKVLDNPKNEIVPIEQSNAIPIKILSTKEKIEIYIDQYSSIAKDEMKAHKIPASIILAQGILESGMGYSRLAKEGNNHFGIKCHKDWSGEKIYHDDDEKGECFRVYKNVASSFRDHSLFLKNRKRYSPLFKMKLSNYKGWAKGLKKAGYATDPEYAEKLISLVERFELMRFDSKIFKRQIENYTPNKLSTNFIHKVKKGDTLYSVSKQYGVAIENLVKFNDIKNQTIFIGQELKIPQRN